MSHNQRLYWLRTLGFEAQDRGAELKELGQAVVVSGIRNGEHESFWLAARDGSAVIHGENTPVKSWQELQAWIQEKPAVAKPVVKERSLFGDYE